ncbi:DUF2087 domain-containing protein [Jatrophihabitans fulvus]
MPKTDDPDLVLRRYVRDGRLMTMPKPGPKRQVVLEHLVQRFEPGVHYAEVDVNLELRQVWSDTAALRRYLVEAGLLDRTPGGEYWRSGGPVTAGE